MKRFRFIAVCALLAMAFAPVRLHAGSDHFRVVRSINDGWCFSRNGVSQSVNIPHCINASDTWDEEPGYWRGKCSYSRTVFINDDLCGRRVYLRFEGVGQCAELFVNGQCAGSHKGGYTAFIFDITEMVRPGANEIVVNVDNTPDPDLAPLAADFTFYGGIYRDVNLVIVPQNHISVSHYASGGVYLTTPSVSREKSVVNARVHIDAAPAQYIVRNVVYSPEGRQVAVSDSAIGVTDSVKVFDMRFEMENCTLWDVDNPAVYRVQTMLCDRDGKVLDSVVNPLGLRTFSFDAGKGFTLNGRSLKLMGTNRHQDYLDRGNALSDEDHLRDVMMLKSMGGNFLRISHYPQDQIVPQTCDREGLVATIEIPVNDKICESDAFRENCVEMAREMVCQNFNHPSIVVWAYMNECLLKVPVFTGDDAQSRKSEYFAKVVELACAIDAAIKELDPYRPTMIPCDSDPGKYTRCGVARVPDIVGWNHYQGWYTNTFEDFDTAVAKEHEMFPDKPLIVTEYGAGVDPRIHSDKPQRLDFSMEYGTAFHKHYYQTIRKTPWIAGSNVWNLNDFYSEDRGDAVPHVNNKGLVGLDRTPKDSYLMYKALFATSSYLAIGGRNWALRGGNQGQKMTVEVYTNASAVTLYHNGRKVGSRKVSECCAAFEIVPEQGENVLCTRAAKGLSDAVRFDYAMVPSDMSEFVCLNVTLGTDCQFEDAVQGAAWIPEQPYKKGSWGYVGGERYVTKSWNGFLPGSNADIKGTVNDPLFQTQRVGIGAFKADVPDGTYYVTLYFAELDAEPLERVFDVTVNGVTLIKDYDIVREEGVRKAAIRKFEVDVAGGQGLDISFPAAKGSAVLNAVRIYRCM